MLSDSNIKKLDDSEVNYVWDDDNEVNSNVELAFSKNNADLRKKWLESYDKNEILDYFRTLINLKNFTYLLVVLVNLCKTNQRLCVKLLEQQNNLLTPTVWTAEYRRQ